MDKKQPRKIIYRAFILIALLASTILLLSMIRGIDPDLVMYGDTFQYWAAGRLFLSGDNPYDYDNVSELRNIVGYKKVISEDAISMMLYPPWIFPILIPFSILSYSPSRMIWLFFHIIIVFLSSRTMWYLFKGPKKLELLAYVVSFSFTPTLYVLGIGHITTLHLLGIVIFLYCLNKRSRISDLTAGFAVALTLLKPQLLFIFLIVLALWILSTKRWWVLSGMIIFITLNMTISILVDQKIVSQYLDAIIKYPMGTWATPTFGMLLRLFLGIEKDWLQMLPSIVGIIWVLFHWLKRRNSWDWLKETPLLLLISFTFSPYMWTYDMVILVVPMIYAMVLIIHAGLTTRSIFSIAIYIVLNLFALLLHRTRPDFWFFWLAPMLLIWFCFTENVVTKSSIFKASNTTNFGMNI